MSIRDKSHVLSFVLSSWLIAFVGSALAQKTAGQVVGVLDGDTIEVLHDHALNVCAFMVLTARRKAKHSGSQRSKPVELETYGRDKYKRTVAEVFCETAPMLTMCWFNMGTAGDIGNTRRTI
jgi:endonuclease YncB( thermonuclease family)